jgi:hypothetical protein
MLLDSVWSIINRAAFATSLADSIVERSTSLPSNQGVSTEPGFIVAAFT